MPFAGIKVEFAANKAINFFQSSQESRHARMPLLLSQILWCSATVIPGSHIRSFLSQQLYHVYEPFHRRPVQRCPAMSCLS